jgi:hypothetical protein
VSDWARVEEVFHSVVELPADEREARVQLLCEHDEWLRAEVKKLLRADGGATTLRLRDIEEAAEKVRKGVEVASGGVAPETIGPFSVLGTVGQGELGTVYLCEHEQWPGEKFAVKIVRGGFSPTRIAERFGTFRAGLEAQGIPGLARPIAAGKSAQGPAYLAHEFVDGGAITFYADAMRLPIAGRAALLAEACGIVGALHAGGHAHGSVRASNVLITTVGGRATARLQDAGTRTALFAGKREGAALAEPSIDDDLRCLRALCAEVLGPTRRDLEGDRERARQLAHARGLHTAGRLIKAMGGDAGAVVEQIGSYASAGELGCELDRLARGVATRAKPRGWAASLRRALGFRAG